MIYFVVQYYQRAHAHTYTHTHRERDKMVDDVNEGVEHALKCLVSVKERSGNLRNDLKKDILEVVNSLRNYFVHVQTNLVAKTAAHKELEREFKQSKDEIQRLRDGSMGYVEPSHDSI